MKLSPEDKRMYTCNIIISIILISITQFVYVMFTKDLMVISAEITSISSELIGNGVESIRPVFKYDYNGSNYIASDKNSYATLTVDREYDTGDICYIVINKKHPSVPTIAGNNKAFILFYDLSLTMGFALIFWTLKEIIRKKFFNKNTSVNLSKH